MPMQFSNNITINQSVKRRMFDDDSDDDNFNNNNNTFQINEETIKRVNNLNQTFDPTKTSIDDNNETKLPSLTYASPDYRPLPRKDALWLQPVPQTTPLNLNNNNDHIMEDDLTDEDDSVPTPCYQPNNQMAPSTSTSTNHHHSTNNKMNPSVDWMMSEQC